MKTVISKDGTAIAYEQMGQGEPVILVDGALCFRGFGPMGGLAPLLADNFRVYMYDRRGRGESGDTPPYAVEREIEDIEALIQQAGGSAYVYGISSGAVLALHTAAHTPAIKKLALYEPPYVVDDSRSPVPDDYVPQLKQMIASGRPADALELFMVGAVGMPAQFVTPMRNMPMWPMMETVAPTLIYDGIIMGDGMHGNALPPDITRMIGSISVPALVMAGGASPASLQNAARAVADALPHAQYRALEGQTHEVSAEALAPHLLAFFKGE